MFVALLMHVCSRPKCLELNPISLYVPKWYVGSHVTEVFLALTYSSFDASVQAPAVCVLEGSILAG